MRPGEGVVNGRLDPAHIVVRRAIEFDGEETGAVVRDEGGARDAVDRLGCGFNGKGIQRALAIADPRAAAAHQPEAAVCVEITGVAGAMPDLAAVADLGFAVARAI